MTAKQTYNSNVHQYVLFENKGGLETGSFEGPCAIIHHTKDRVWVPACYADFPIQEDTDIVQVGDGGTTGYDADGNCIMSIHVRHVTSYLTEKEAEDIAHCMAVDQQLLSYAI